MHITRGLTHFMMTACTIQIHMHTLCVDRIKDSRFISHKISLCPKLKPISVLMEEKHHHHYQQQQQIHRPIHSLSSNRIMCLILICLIHNYTKLD